MERAELMTLRPAAGADVLSTLLAAPSGGVADVGPAADDLGLARAGIRTARERQSYGRYAEADVLLTRAVEHAGRAGAEPEQALAAGALALSLWHGPEPVAAALSRGRVLLDEHGAGRPSVRLALVAPLAVLLAMRERWDDAYACLADARRLAGELGYAEGPVALPLFTAAVESLAGDDKRALVLLDEAAEAGREARADGLLVTVARSAARLLVDAGRHEEAADRLYAAGSGGSQAAATPAVAADLDGLLARIAMAGGRVEEAVALADRAVATAAGTDSPAAEAVARLDQADVLRCCGRLAEARYTAALAGRSFALKGHLPGASRAVETHASVTPAVPARPTA